MIFGRTNNSVKIKSAFSKGTEEPKGCLTAKLNSYKMIFTAQIAKLK